MPQALCSELAGTNARQVEQQDLAVQYFICLTGGHSLAIFTSIAMQGGCVCCILYTSDGTACQLNDGSAGAATSTLEEPTSNSRHPRQQSLVRWWRASSLSVLFASHHLAGTNYLSQP